MTDQQKCPDCGTILQERQKMGGVIMVHGDYDCPKNLIALGREMGLEAAAVWIEFGGGGWINRDCQHEAAAALRDRIAKGDL